MKVIFLDIDGVLNSRVYDRERGECEGYIDGRAGGNIDVSRLVLLKEIVDKSGALIVLSSNWREHWGQREEDCDDVGRELNATFREAGLRIADKTPYSRLGRSREIGTWLSEHPDVEAFVILDDIGGGWGDMCDNLVRTNYRIGRGLEEVHVSAALRVLCKKDESEDKA